MHADCQGAVVLASIKLCISICFSSYTCFAALASGDAGFKHLQKLHCEVTLDPQAIFTII